MELNLNMELWVFQAFEFITVIIETFIIYQYINTIFEKNAKAGSKYAYIFFCIILTILSLYADEPLVLIGFTVFALYMIIYIYYQSNLASRLFATFFFVILMIGTDIICTGIIRIGGNIPLSLIQTKEYGVYRIYYNTIAKIIQIFTVKIIGMFFKWKNESLIKIDVSYILPLFFCQIISIFLVYHLFVVDYELEANITLTVFLLIAGVLYINVMIYWYFDRIKTSYEYKQQKELAESKLIYQKQYYEFLDEQQQMTNALWHDMKNHITSLASLYNNGEIIETKLYITDLRKQFEEIPNVVRVSQSVVSALLTEKLRESKKHDIDVFLEIRLPDEVRISPMDMCVILGNLMDNAIEACMMLSNNLRRYINLEITQRDETLLIDITNPYNPEKKTAIRSGIHGYGLKNIYKVINRYNGDITIETKQNVYKISILIP